MDFMKLTAAVCREFEAARDTPMEQVIAVKDGNPRDVVTLLDMRLHEVTREFVRTSDPGARLMSEEGDLGSPASLWAASSLVIVDPLDGSNNYALSLPGYGFMAAHLRSRRIVAATVVLPESGTYLVWDGIQLVTSSPLGVASAAPSSPMYYAYPPSLDEDQIRVRAGALRLADERSTGLYRSGSACIGLYRVLTGVHSAFVGYRVRVWDVLPFLPLLAAHGIAPRYWISGLTATVIASHDEAFAALLQAEHELVGEPRFRVFDSTQALVIGT
jgi:fructose-1,6-bisphosphatase/inositol monophosphatase family enzyme